jgi:hypothetical protein
VLFGSSDRQLGLLTVLQICEICFSVCRWSSLAAGARWFLYSKDVGSEVVNLSFFSDFIDGRKRVLVQDSTGTSPG